VTESHILQPERFLDELHDFEHTAFRLELQRTYVESHEDPVVDAFLAGNPIDPHVDPELALWFERITAHVAQGKTVSRVRVQESPPTPYQQWERWLDRWNTEAGETITYLTRQCAYEIGLLPAAGTNDWWLLDSKRLLLMRFDEAGHRIRNEVVTDPATVVQACAWRDLAVHHSSRPSESLVT
jgi:hypothetical protein